MLPASRSEIFENSEWQASLRYFTDLLHHIIQDVIHHTLYCFIVLKANFSTEVPTVCQIPSCNHIIHSRYSQAGCFVHDIYTTSTNKAYRVNRWYTFTWESLLICLMILQKVLDAEQSFMMSDVLYHQFPRCEYRMGLNYIQHTFQLNHSTSLIKLLVVTSLTLFLITWSKISINWQTMRCSSIYVFYSNYPFSIIHKFTSCKSCLFSLWCVSLFWDSEVASEASWTPYSDT